MKKSSSLFVSMRPHEDMKLVLLVIPIFRMYVITCEMCGKKFNVKGSFKKHAEDVHVAFEHILNTHENGLKYDFAEECTHET